LTFDNHVVFNLHCFYDDCLAGIYIDIENSFIHFFYILYFHFVIVEGIGFESLLHSFILHFIVLALYVGVDYARARFRLSIFLSFFSLFFFSCAGCSGQNGEPGKVLWM